MWSLYRPTVHHIYIIPQVREDPFPWAEAALAHLARWAPTEEVALLHGQLAAAREREQPARDARVALVRSPRLFPVPGREPLRAALFAYREGVSLVLHFIWHLDGDGDESTFTALREALWQPPPDLAAQMGEGILLTAALRRPVADRSALAEAILAAAGQRETGLAALALHGASLHVPRRRPLTPAAYPAVLLFDAAEVEETPAADRFATVLWPLVVLYTLRLEWVYLGRYRGRVVDRLREGGGALQHTLDGLFAQEQAANRIPFTSPDPAQQALLALTTAQHALHDALADAEEMLEDARRELANLTDVLAEALIPGQEGAPLTAASPEAAVRRVSTPARHMVAQMEADVARARAWAERAARAVDALRTQADLLQARYEWVLNWVIGLVGSAVAAAQVVDVQTAGTLREWINAALRGMHAPYLVAENEAGVLLVRGLSMLAALAIVAVVLRFSLAVAQRRRPPGRERAPRRPSQ